MRKTTRKDAVQCHTPKCRCVASVESYKRGLCSACYRKLASVVAQKTMTWDQLVAAGMCKPNYLRGGEAAHEALEALQKQESKPPVVPRPPIVIAEKAQQQQLFGCDPAIRDAMMRIAVAQEAMRDQMVAMTENVVTTRALMRALAKEWGVK